jgi:excisionase family DNA binding protein
MRDYLTTTQAAELLAVGPDRICDWIASGELRAVNVARAANAKKPRWRIARAELDALLLRRQSSPPAPASPRRRKSAASVIEFY